MDPRIREHAEILVDHSVSLQEGDDVVISAPPTAEDLAVALHELCGDVGANPHFSFASSRADRAYKRARGEDFETPDHELALIETADASIRIIGGRNATEQSDVAPETASAHAQAYEPVKEAMLEKRWCLTQWPAPSNAQLAEMSTEAYENFVWDAVNKDWDAQREFQAQLVDILNEGSEVHIRSGEETDLTMSVADRVAINDYGEHNLPGGEVFTAPVADSVEGTVLFDMPLYRNGREIEDVRLEFEGGEVVAHSAAKNEALLTEILNTDDGARRLGELGIGMNRDIDRFTYNMLFDEKMGDTVHMAVGRAYDMCLPEGETGNESAMHVDMIVDMSEDSVIEVDGEVVQRNGTFVFEEGFEG